MARRLACRWADRYRLITIAFVFTRDEIRLTTLSTCAG
jgi:hypothetical protein